MTTVAPPRIGSRLRRARIAAGVSIPEAAWRMRTRPAILRALERDDFDDVGHQADARTHLLSYARLVGLDPAEMAEAFDAHVADAPTSIDELHARVMGSRKPPRARWILAALVSTTLITVAAMTGVLGGQTERPTPEVASKPALAARSGQVPAAEALVRVELVVAERVQVNILADGVEIFDGPLDPSDTQTFRARTMLEVFAADGGAVRATLNGRDLGRIGERGQIARVRIGPRGVTPA